MTPSRVRLKVGAPAPEFSESDIEGRTVGVSSDVGRPLLLSFFRYGSCPLCNLRMAFLIEAYPRLHSLGLHVTAVFESDAATVRDTVGRQPIPFAVIGDPDRRLYRLYAVDASLAGYLLGALRLFSFRAALRRGFGIGKADGAVTQLPAEFLINAQGVIERAYYGRDIGDHLPITEIESLLSTQGASA